MQKLIAAAALSLASLVTVHYVLGANAPDLPKGVGANNWVPVSERLGFVMEPTGYPGGGGDRQALLAAQPIPGYFVVKTSAGWVRLAVENPEGLSSALRSYPAH
jgi:hypothetical protein